MKLARLTIANTMVLVAIGLLLTSRFATVNRGIPVALAAERMMGISARAFVTAPKVMPLGLPSQGSEKSILSASLLHHHPQWVDIPVGAVKIRAFVIYPDLPGRLPVVVVTAENQGLSDWARA